jgi:DNA-binding NarL/FixJ family response regulator
VAPVPAGRRADRLTEREIEVLRLLAAGRSNKEIAGTLTTSARTVERHIANIYHKLGINRRHDATAYAVQQGITAGKS